MKNRIQFSLIYMGILSAFFAVYFTANVFEGEMTNQLKSHLRESSLLIEMAYSKLENTAELKKFANDSLRITLIASDGSVLFESDSSLVEMGNHKERPEVANAFNNGEGENLRHSVSLDANIFYYAKKLSDGNVLRLGMRQANLSQAFSKTTPYLLVLLSVIILVSILAAIGLGRIFIRPIQKLSVDISNPDFINDDSVYKEIAPLIKKIRNQNRELQIMVDQLSEEKQKTTRMKDEFTANASHELKTPLTSISGYAELIEHDMAKPEDVKLFAAKIHKEAERLLAIANDIMTLSKLDEPSVMSLNLDEDVNLLELAYNCVEELSLTAKKKGVEVSIESSVGGADDEKRSVIKGNAKLLFEMVYNLVDNAIRYTEFGGNVVVAVAKREISVKDTGVGIPEESQVRVFERFYRVDKSRSKATGGTGLGLAIVKHVAEVHNASIDLKSIVGVGTEIRVHF